MQSTKPKVPLIRQDVSHEETVLQIAFALDSLQTIVEKVFSDVEERMNKQKTRIKYIKNRCSRANDKVLRIKGINKSITVYSSAKYPVPEQNLFFEAFDHSVQITRPDIKINYTPLPPNKMTLKEKMKFYHLKDSTQILRRNEEVKPLVGLGPIPDSIRSVSSLCLFNTSHNIYTKYEMINPLTISKQSTLKVTEEKQQLEPPPVSIKGPLLGTKNIPNYFYNPISQDVPDIQVPMDLPNLPGIANDLRYDDNLASETVVQKPVQAPVRPTITEDKITIVQELPKLETGPSSATAPPPPPPPPPPPIPEPEPLPEHVDHPPPPPPPDKGLQPNIPSLEPVSDMRANLMEAIRLAGGKSKLKSVKQETKKALSSEGPKSLMEDLHDKLLMRRKGILGKTESTEVNILGQIASMIPPPPVKQQESEEEDDQEWDD